MPITSLQTAHNTSAFKNSAGTSPRVTQSSRVRRSSPCRGRAAFNSSGDALCRNPSKSFKIRSKSFKILMKSLSKSFQNPSKSLKIFSNDLGKLGSLSYAPDKPYWEPRWHKPRAQRNHRVHTSTARCQQGSPSTHIENTPYLQCE